MTEELAPTIHESADNRRIHPATLLIRPIQAPFIGLRIEQPYGKSLDGTSGSTPLVLLNIPATVPYWSDSVLRAERFPIIRILKSVPQTKILDMPTAKEKVEIVLSRDVQGRGGG
jgi:hypothetical protein